MRGVQCCVCEHTSTRILESCQVEQVSTAPAAGGSDATRTMVGAEGLGIRVRILESGL